ncbi:MAG: hypothetical protein NWP35_00605 [Ilumatobacteraceae bacterium]|jgi:hypothetical protein|nr:hypothetical protein [Ilumatobacteraceae bacterium]
MKTLARYVILIVGATSLSACATEIVGSTQSTIPVVTTTTTLPAPIGDIESLLTQLHTEATGLGQLVVDGKTSEAALIVARADAIWVAIEPQILESKIDIAEDVKRIVDLFHTAAERKRPADADKAVRFTTLMLESVPQLLNK